MRNARYCAFVGLGPHGSERLASTLRAHVEPSSFSSSAWIRAHGHVIALGMIATVSLLLRVDIARNTSLWLDEMYTLRDVNRGIYRILVGPNPDHPGLVYVATKLGMLVFGDGDVALRAASLAFGTATLGAVYLLSRELGFGRALALLTVAAFALAPLFVRHAVEARHYAPLMFFTALSLLSVLRIEREPNRRRHYLLLAGSTLATLLTHYYGATSIAAAHLTLAGVVLAAFRRRDAGRARLLRWCALAVGPVLVTGFVIALFRFTRIASHYGAAEGDSSPRSTTGALAQLLLEFSPMHGSVLVAYTFAAFALIGLIGALIARRAAGVLLLLALLLPVVGLAAMASTVAFRPRYAVAAFVVHYLLAVAGMSSVVRWVAARTARHVGRHDAFVRHADLAPALLLGVLVAARAMQLPAGYSAGTFHHAGLRDYVRAGAGRTALTCYVGFVCQQMMSAHYATDPAPIRLERFRQRPGVERYLVAEFHVDRARRKRFAALLRRHFGLSWKAWNALPLVELPATRYQPAMRARLIEASEIPARVKQAATTQKKKRARREGPNSAGRP
jgi:4-amino-4-deoxy-L-arabinose transferase-like glycosyltransferase